MQKYGLFDAEGFPIGFYSEDIHGTDVPAEAVEITDEQWEEFLVNPTRRKWLNGQVVEAIENETQQNIVTAPNDLFGGPTLGETFNGN